MTLAIKLKYHYFQYRKKRKLSSLAAPNVCIESIDNIPLLWDGLPKKWSTNEGLHKGGDGGSQFFYHTGPIQRMSQWRKQIFTVGKKWEKEFYTGASIINDVPVSEFVGKGGSILIMENMQPKKSPSFDKAFNTGSPLKEGMIVSVCNYVLATQASGEKT